MSVLWGVAVGFHSEHVFAQFDLVKTELALGIGSHSGIVIDLLN